MTIALLGGVLEFVLALGEMYYRNCISYDLPREEVVSCYPCLDLVVNLLSTTHPRLDNISIILNISSITGSL